MVKLAADWLRHRSRSRINSCAGAGLAESVYLHPAVHIVGEGNLQRRITIGDLSCFGGSIHLETPQAEVHVGQRCAIDAQLVSACGITIGSDVLIASGTLIQDHDGHSTEWDQRKNDVMAHRHERLGLDDGQQYHKDWSVVAKAPIVIQDKVWIGIRTIILKGVTIGEGAVIAAGSIVTNDVQAWTVVAGNPPQTVRDLER